MRAFRFDEVSDDRLLAGLAALVARERENTAALLAYLGEVDERELFLPAACPSMHAYCVRVLKFSEEVAFKRIRAARIARQFPAILDAIAEGRVHVTGVVMLAPHFRAENVEELLAAMTHASKAELEKLVARLAPRPDLPALITRMGAGQDVLELDPDPVRGQVDPDPVRGQVDPDPVGGQVDPDPVGGQVDLDPVPGRVQARAPDRYGLQVTISEATRDKLLRAQALLRHRNPNGELEVVIDRALDALLAVLEKEKFGKTSRPRAAKARSADADPRYVPNEVRRVVSERDGEQCAFVNDEGVRCTERGFLELDHRTLVCRGAQPTVGEMRWLCGPHNRYEAERLLGKDFVRRKRAEARAQRGNTEEPEGTAAGAARESAAEPACVDAVEPAGACGPATVHAAAGAGGAESAATAGDARTTEPETVGERGCAGELEREVTLAMRGMGFGAGETRRAMEESAKVEARDFEARLRAALAAWRGMRGTRCSEGPFDEAARRLAWQVDAGQGARWATGGMRGTRCSEGAFDEEALRFAWQVEVQGA